MIRLKHDRSSGQRETCSHSATSDGPLIRAYSRKRYRERNATTEHCVWRKPVSLFFSLSRSLYLSVSHSLLKQAADPLAPYASADDSRGSLFLPRIRPRSEIIFYLVTVVPCIDRSPIISRQRRHISHKSTKVTHLTKMAVAGVTHCAHAVGSALRTPRSRPRRNHEETQSRSGTRSPRPIKPSTQARTLSLPVTRACVVFRCSSPQRRTDTVEV